MPQRDLATSQRNLFSLDLRAKKHLMLAGGIGITPFMAQTAQLAAEGGNFELHYACRTASLFTYADVLQERYGKRIHLYHDDLGEKIETALRQTVLDRLGLEARAGTPLADQRAAVDRLAAAPQDRLAAPADAHDPGPRHRGRRRPVASALSAQASNQWSA